MTMFFSIIVWSELNQHLLCPEHCKHVEGILYLDDEHKLRRFVHSLGQVDPQGFHVLVGSAGPANQSSHINIKYFKQT